MAKKTKTTDEVAPTRLDQPFPVPLDDLPCLRLFGLALNSEGDAKTQAVFEIPEGTVGAPAPKAFNKALAKITITSKTMEITTPKVWGLSWSFYTKTFGEQLVEFLKWPREGASLTVTFSKGAATQIYRGAIADGLWTIDSMAPAVPPADLQSAWQVAGSFDKKAIVCADEAEADAIAAAIRSDKYLRDMGVKRQGLKFSCERDYGQLAVLLFRHRHGERWQVPLSRKKTAPRESAMEKGLREWRERSTPTAAALKGFEAIRELLLRHTQGGPLKSKPQEFPPKLELILPPAKKGQHEWDFAAVAAVANDIYFDLYPLGLDVTLRNSASADLRKLTYRADDGFKIPDGAGAVLDEIDRLIQSAWAWFQTEIVPSRPLPPCQFIDHYLIEPVDELAGLQQDEEFVSDAFVATVRYQTLTPSEKNLRSRLQAAFGKGRWDRGELMPAVMLPGWSKPCDVEIHWYDRHSKTGGREPWKIKRFLKGAPKEVACDCELIYAAASDFAASLQAGATYPCSATLGRMFQQYVRIRDESGEEYWYPERLFVR